MPGFLQSLDTFRTTLEISGRVIVGDHRSAYTASREGTFVIISFSSGVFGTFSFDSGCTPAVAGTRAVLSIPNRSVIVRV